MGWAEKALSLVVSRSKIIGLKVYTSSAKYVGVVRDLGFDLREPSNMHLVVEAGKGAVVEIPASKIAALGDIIILAEGYAPPPPTPASETGPAEPSAGDETGEEYVIPRCPHCSSPLIYYPQAGKWYCRKCGKYVDIPQTVASRVPRCPTCGNPLSYIEEYGKWFCYQCNKYVDV